MSINLSPGQTAEGDGCAQLEADLAFALAFSEPGWAQGPVPQEARSAQTEREFEDSPPSFVFRAPEDAKPAEPAPKTHWSRREHERFLQALEALGKLDNKAIARALGSKSCPQVAQHARDFFRLLKGAVVSYQSLSDDAFRAVYARFLAPLAGDRGRPDPANWKQAAIVRRLKALLDAGLGPNAARCFAERELAPQVRRWFCE